MVSFLWRKNLTCDHWCMCRHWWTLYILRFTVISLQTQLSVTFKKPESILPYPRNVVNFSLLYLGNVKLPLIISWRLIYSFTKVFSYSQAINKIVLKMKEKMCNWVGWYHTWRLMVCDKVQVHTYYREWYWRVNVRIIIILFGSEDKYLLFTVTVGKKGLQFLATL